MDLELARVVRGQQPLRLHTWRVYIKTDRRIHKTTIHTQPKEQTDGEPASQPASQPDIQTHRRTDGRTDRRAGGRTACGCGDRNDLVVKWRSDAVSDGIIYGRNGVVTA